MMILDRIYDRFVQAVARVLQAHFHRRFNTLEEMIMSSKADVLQAISDLNAEIQLDFDKLGQIITDGGSLDDVMAAINNMKTATAQRFVGLGVDDPNGNPPPPTP